MESYRNVEAFAALGHPGRLAVFRLLARRAPDGVRPSEIAQALGMKPNTLSVNVAGLVRAGLGELCPTVWVDAGERANATAEYDRRRALLTRLQASAASVSPNGTRVVAKQFLAELKKMDVPTTSNGVLSGSDVDCNAKIKCPHGLLKPRCNPKPLRVDAVSYTHLTLPTILRV